MKIVHRALLLCLLLVVAGVFGFSAYGIAGEMAADMPRAADIEHPMKNPPADLAAGKCPNCGMMLNMWGRTRHEFDNSEGHHGTCSIRCLADMSMRSGEEAKNVKVASYLHPETMIPSAQAVYVVGSEAVGTMTMVSKVAFASAEEAKSFTAVNNGEVLDYPATLARASVEIEKSRAIIDAKRKKTGKVKEPAATDSCVVCGMHPEKYPMHRAQILAADDSTIHFCSNQCLVNYLAEPGKYLTEPPQNKWIWVTVYPDGDIDNADGLYYVAGSKMHGPMGPEALPFRKKADAEAFAAKEGGSVLPFNQLTPDMIGGGHGHGMGGMNHGHK